ncbi:hypothetical protein MU516_12970 [Paracoccus sp. YLB-12]|uniref:Uncharacterized protein n=1 Tax=Paracoccus maritimus TaxID=2933292 RepID=A0ABT2KB94_9RHOB|nr:hypothetical protein [Paracoccus sp. YLB-12]MCT4333776.1 hypothetical protein [Paracoccus sp. YLB-12]
MATLPRIIHTLQPYDGRDESSLSQHGRLLREAGFIPGGKRGVGAPHMTHRHAALLLLGIFASPTPKDSVATIGALGSLRHHFTDGPLTEHFNWLDGPDFIEALSLLIERAPEITGLLGDLIVADRERTIEQIEVIREQAANGAGLIDFKIEISAASATILASWGPHELLKVIYMMDSDRFMAGEYNSRLNSDRKVTTTFSLRTIVALHNAINGD